MKARGSKCDRCGKGPVFTVEDCEILCVKCFDKKHGLEWVHIGKKQNEDSNV